MGLLELKTLMQHGCLQSLVLHASWVSSRPLGCSAGFRSGLVLRRPRQTGCVASLALFSEACTQLPAHTGCSACRPERLNNRYMPAPAPASHRSVMFYPLGYGFLPVVPFLYLGGACGCDTVNYGYGGCGAGD